MSRKVQLHHACDMRGTWRDSLFGNVRDHSHDLMGLISADAWSPCANRLMKWRRKAPDSFFFDFPDFLLFSIQGFPKL